MTAPADPAVPSPGRGTATVHLVRHGEVDNPRRVIYGRIPGYHLSAAGVGMAEAAAAYLAGRDVTVVRCSPLTRAVETAAPIAAEFGEAATVDERLIEPWSHFEGLRFGVGDGALRQPRHWLALRNPFRPSWGEPYADVAARILAATADAAAAAGRPRGGPPRQDDPQVTERLTRFSGILRRNLVM